MDLHVLQDWVLDKAFRAVPGVADVASLGGETMQYQVLVDPTKLAGAGLAISDVSDGARREQQQRRRRLHLRGRAVLLRARPRPRRHARGHRQRRHRREEQRAGARERHRNGRDRIRAAARPVRLQQDGRRGRRHHPDAHRRAGADGAQARRSEDARAQRPRPAQGREDRAVLRPQRSRRADDAHRGGQPPPRHRARRDRADLLPVRHSRRGSIVAITVPLSLLVAFICLDLRDIPANLLVHRRDRLRHSGRRRRGDGREHLPAARATARHDVQGERRDSRRGVRGEPADRLRDRGDRRRLPADLCAHGSVGQAVPSDGRHDDLRAARIAGADADGHSRALPRSSCGRA